MSKWTEEEDEILIQNRINAGLSYGKISNLLFDRTRNSVRHRWEAIRDKINLNKVLLGSKEREGGPKILVFDIETAPLLVYTFGVHQQYINPDNVEEDWYVISWAAKWLHEDKVYSEVVTSKESINLDDKRICAKMWELFDKADLIIAHNGDRFDIKKMNWRFIIHGFPPPMLYKTVDTLKVARSKFGATSNKMDFLTDALGLGRKVTTGGMSLWKLCKKGDTKALEKMLEYNINDIIILEELYLELLPWVTNHPNLGLFDDREIKICPVCGSDKIIISDKITITSVNSYLQYRCGNKKCNHVGRSKIKATTLDKRKEMLSN